MERELQVGNSISYVDPHGVRHNALVTVVWTPAAVPTYAGPNGEPGCNLVIVSGDESKSDQYGRQIERATSVVHKSKQPAHGSYWCWPDE